MISWLHRTHRRWQFYRKVRYTSARGLLLVSRDAHLFCHRTSQIVIEDGTVRLGFPLPHSRGFAHLMQSTFEIEEGAMVIFKGNCWIAPGFTVKVKKGGRLVVGKSVSMAHNCCIYCSSDIQIGDHVGTSWNVTLIDDDGHTYYDPEGAPVRREKRPLILEDHSTIHMHVIIPRGVRLGKNCVVGAGTVVRQDIPAESLVYHKQELRIKKGLCYDRIAPVEESSL